MPSTLTAYGNLLSRSETERYTEEVGAARAAIADRVGEPGTVNVTGLVIVAPTGECEFESGHAESTDELVWLTDSRDTNAGFDGHHMHVCRGCLPDAVADVLRSPVRGTPQVHVGVLQQLMTVFVEDPASERGYRQVTVSVRCSTCWQLRGRPESRRSYTAEHGVYSHQVWTNPCGHTDELPALLTEHAVIERSQARTGLAVAA
ncbi:hypothetical protein [Pseudonocardia sp. NPDC049635]|uniref:hypothetical protein n=1 Tax=Pseudonocardia sp. NPDC049635 TaxID=3155506 RepID=UPI0033E80A95